MMGIAIAPYLKLNAPTILTLLRKLGRNKILIFFGTHNQALNLTDLKFK